MSGQNARTKKLMYSTDRMMVSHETGQIHSESHTNVVLLPQEPPFVKIYLQDIAKILDLTEGPRSVLMILVRKIDYDGMICLTPSSRKRLAEKLNITVGTFNNYLVSLVSSNILQRVGIGEYEVNPHLIAKGDWKSIQNRRASFKLTVTYKPDGTKTVSGSVEAQEEMDL